MAAEKTVSDFNTEFNFQGAARCVRNGMKHLIFINNGKGITSVIGAWEKCASDRDSTASSEKIAQKDAGGTVADVIIFKNAVLAQSFVDFMRKRPTNVLNADIPVIVELASDPSGVPVAKAVSPLAAPK